MPEIKPQNYKDSRPASTFDRFHERSRTHDPNWMYDLVRVVTTPISLFVYRLRAIEADNVPSSGPVILAANHFSNFDHFLELGTLRRGEAHGSNRRGGYDAAFGVIDPLRGFGHDEERFKFDGLAAEARQNIEAHADIFRTTRNHNAVGNHDLPLHAAAQGDHGT